MTPPPSDRDARQARHFAQCVREAKFCAAVWIAAWVVCATIALKFGYLPPEQRPDEPWLILGMPGWVFFGVIIPWLILIGLTVWFAAAYIKDDEPCDPFPESKADTAAPTKEAAHD